MSIDEDLLDILQPAILLKVTLPHGCKKKIKSLKKNLKECAILNCTNGTK